MVKVRQHHPQEADDQVDIGTWVADLVQCHAVTESDTQSLINACTFARQALTEDFDPERLWVPTPGAFKRALKWPKFSLN